MLGNTPQFIQHFNTLKVLLGKTLQSKSKQSEQGLTLLESLVSIVVVTAVISAITPPIFLVTASRVQNRRADQAKQLAQASVDRVRRLVETGNYSKDDLDRLVPYVVGNVYNDPVPAEPKQLVSVKSKEDFRVQVFRTAGILDPTDPSQRPLAFKLGVRVYVNFADGQQTFETKPSSLGLTTAIGSQRRRPLAVMYTDVAVSDNQNSLPNYKQFTQ